MVPVPFSHVDSILTPNPPPRPSSMPRPAVRVFSPSTPGRNCYQETAFAFQQAVVTTEVLHINRLLEAPEQFRLFQVFCIPGGFSYGDDLGAGRILGSQMQHHLAGEMTRFRAEGKLILGICNGFQVSMKLTLPLDRRRRGRTGRDADLERLRPLPGSLGSAGGRRNEERLPRRHRADVLARRPRRRELLSVTSASWTTWRPPASSCSAMRPRTIPTARWGTWPGCATAPAACWD